MFSVDLGEEGAETARGDFEACGVEDLRSDVGVEPDEAQVRGGEQAAHRLGSRPVAEGQPELLVVVGGGDELVGVCLHAGGDTDQHFGDTASLRGDPLQPVDLVEGVDDDPSDADFDGPGQFGRGLVVAVHADPLGREPRGQGDSELAAGAHVEFEPFLGHPAGHRLGEQGLARVVDVGVLEGETVVAGAGPEVCFVDDVERGAEFPGEFGDADTADGDLAVDSGGCARPDAGVELEEVRRRAGWVFLRQHVRVARSGGMGVTAHG